MKKKIKFCIVDDDPVSAKMILKLLEAAGHKAGYYLSSSEALPHIIKQKPDCVLLDIMMPEIDGLEMCKRLRREPKLNPSKIIIVSGKSYEIDRHRAFSFGADGFILKPIDPQKFVDQVLRIISDHIDLAFWGVRGTLPVPGRNSVKYGGNTSCVSMEFSRGTLFIFDAGTGIKSLSDSLLRRGRAPIEAKIFISHPHWDHINALPFFTPLYVQGNEFEICGPSHGDIPMKDLIFGQMDGVHFPIKIKEFSSRVFFRALKEEDMTVENITVQTMLLNHPGHCLGYRVEYQNRSICYVTDNELYPRSSPYYNGSYLNRLVQFVQKSHALITDCTYTDEEYVQKINWGHSAVSQVVDLARQADVQSLFLIHHDPEQNDLQIDAKRSMAQALMKEKGGNTKVIAPREGQVFKV